MVKRVQYEKGTLKLFRDFFKLRKAIADSIDQSRKKKMLYARAIDLIYTVRFLPSQSAGATIERHVIEILDLEKAKRSTGYDAFDDEGTTYEIKGSDAAGGVAHIVQYRHGAQDYLLWMVLGEDDISLFKLSEADMCDEKYFPQHRWGSAHGAKQTRGDAGYEERITLQTSSVHYNNIVDDRLIGYWKGEQSLWT